MEGVKEVSSQLEVQEICQEQDTHNPPPQYEDVTQESDLESDLASSSASQSKRKRKFSWTLEQEEDLVGNINSY